ncbi:MAG: hypothetical protein QGG54_14700 [Gammaproteobacteria bacterium]|nr:hypothetical protein [Gammaproteobacteria bacterium]
MMSSKFVVGIQKPIPTESQIGTESSVAVYTGQLIHHPDDDCADQNDVQVVLGAVTTGITPVFPLADAGLKCRLIIIIVVSILFGQDQINQINMNGDPEKGRRRDCQNKNRCQNIYHRVDRWKQTVVGSDLRMGSINGTDA